MLIDWLIIDCCLTSSKHYFSYIHDENKFINEGEMKQPTQRLVRRNNILTVIVSWRLLDKYFRPFPSSVVFFSWQSKFVHKWGRDETTDATTCNCHWEIMDCWVGTKIAQCRIYNAFALFRNLLKDVFVIVSWRLLDKYFRPFPSSVVFFSWQSKFRP
jgi:hypothetical protein